MKPQLYDFQEDGVDFIYRKRGRVLLADEMGLGKTAQSLIWLKENPDLRPAVFITPASLKLNWTREMHKWGLSNESITVLNGKTPYRDQLHKRNLIIINFEILGNYKNGKTWVVELDKIRPKVLIVDEAHRLKDWKTQQSKAVQFLTRKNKIPHVLLLTGTPMVNGPKDLYVPLTILDPKHTPKFTSFMFRYCGAKKTRFGWDYSGATNMDELNEHLRKRVMIRRLKKEVLESLPDKITNTIELKISKTSMDEYLNAIRGAHGKNPLAVVEELRQICLDGKLPKSVNWIKDFLNDNPNEKLVVFSWHKYASAKLSTTFNKISVTITGETPNKKRQEYIDKFQNDPDTRLFIGNIKAAGVGITLTASSTVAFLEFPWTPADLSQATDRVHRIGQEYPVNVFYLISNAPIEMHMLSIITDKADRFRRVIEGGKSAVAKAILKEMGLKVEE